jgi:alpha-N-arabinofuranosidase
VEGDGYTYGLQTIPAVSVSASSKDGKTLITLTNAHFSQDADVTLDCAAQGSISALVLATEAANAMNTFDNPHAVKPVAFTAFAKREGGLSVTLPARSVVSITIG